MAQTFPVVGQPSIRPDYSTPNLPGIDLGNVFNYFRTLAFNKNMALEESKLVTDNLKDITTNLNGLRTIPRYEESVNKLMEEYRIPDLLKNATTADGIVNLRTSMNKMMVTPVMQRVVQETAKYDEHLKYLNDPRNIALLGSEGATEASKELTKLAVGVDETGQKIGDDQNMFTYNPNKYLKGLQKTEQYAANQDQRAANEDKRADQKEVRDEKIAEANIKRDDAATESYKAEAAQKRKETEIMSHDDTQVNKALEKFSERVRGIAKSNLKDPDVRYAVICASLKSYSDQDYLNCLNEYRSSEAEFKSKARAESSQKQLGNYIYDSNTNKVHHINSQDPREDIDMNVTRREAFGVSGTPLKIINPDKTKILALDSEDFKKFTGQAGSEYISPDAKLTFVGSIIDKNGIVTLNDKEGLKISKGYNISDDVNLHGRKTNEYGDPEWWWGTRGDFINSLRRGSPLNNVAWNPADTENIKKAAENIFNATSINLVGGKLLRTNKDGTSNIYARFVPGTNQLGNEVSTTLQTGRFETNDPYVLMGILLDKKGDISNPEIAVRVEPTDGGKDLKFIIDNAVLDVNNRAEDARPANSEPYSTEIHSWIRDTYYKTKNGIKSSTSDLDYSGSGDNTHQQSFNDFMQNDEEARKIAKEVDSAKSSNNAAASLITKGYSLQNLKNIKADNNPEDVAEFNILSDVRLTLGLNQKLDEASLEVNKKEFTADNGAMHLVVTDSDRKGSNTEHKGKRAQDIRLVNPGTTTFHYGAEEFGKLLQNSQIMRRYLDEAGLTILYEYNPKDTPKELIQKMQETVNNISHTRVRLLDNEEATAPHLHMAVDRNTPYYSTLQIIREHNAAKSTAAAPDSAKATPVKNTIGIKPKSVITTTQDTINRGGSSSTISVGGQ